MKKYLLMFALFSVFRYHGRGRGWPSAVHARPRFGVRGVPMKKYLPNALTMAGLLAGVAGLAMWLSTLALWCVR